MPAPSLLDVGRRKARGFGFGVAFGDRLFRLAVGPGRELSIQTAPTEAPRINTTSSPEEASPEYGLVFARSQFEGGQGLFRAHTEGAAPDRFWDSKNVAVNPADPGEFPEIRLLHSTSNVDSLAGSELRTAYDDHAGALYVCSGTTLRKSTNPTAGTPTFADDDPHDGETATDVEDVAVLGDEVYAALGVNGIHRYTGGAWSHWSNLDPALRAWGVKGRVVASDGDSLYELDPAGGAAPSALLTLPPGETWTDVVDGGAFILAAASDGYVYAFTTESGSMVLSGQTLFEGEEPSALGQTQGVVAVGTSGSVGRLYIGELSEAGQVVNLRLVKEWDDHEPHRIIGTRSALITAVQDGTDTFLWRYDVVAAGLSRHLTAEGVSGNGHGIEAIDGTLFLTVDGSGVWRETSTFVDEGWLIGPLGDFFTSSDKSWIGTRLETGALTSGMAVGLFYTTDPNALSDPESSGWRRVTRRESGSGDPGEMPLTDVVSRSLALMVKLYPATGAGSSPAVRSFSARAYPSSGDEDVIVTLPVNVSDQIERRGMGRRRVKGRGAVEFAALTALEGRPTTMRLFKPDVTVRGLVESVGTPVQAITNRGSTTLVSQVRVRGRRTTAGESVTSGVGALGTYRTLGEPPVLGGM